jgi:hypothetical protein
MSGKKSAELTEAEKAAHTQRVRVMMAKAQGLPRCSKCLAVGLPKNYRCEINGCPGVRPPLDCQG